MKPGLKWCTSPVLVGLLVLVACVSPEISYETKVAATPIALGPEGSRPLVFLHVVERIPAGTRLGVAHWENSDVALDEIRASGQPGRSGIYNVAVTDLLRQSGYTVLDEADAVFNSDQTVRVRYQLAGVIHGGEVDYAYKRSRSRRGEPPVARGTAKVDFELQVYDAIERTTVFKRRYGGAGVDTGTEPQPWVPAVVDAVRAALADPDFVATVTDGEQGIENSSTDTALTQVSTCRPVPVDLPAQLDELLESVVVVKVGGGRGTGVIISEQGHLLTADHVVGVEKSPMVGLRSGLELPAEVLVRNPSRDLALLKIPGRGYRCSPIVRKGLQLPIGADLYAFSVVIDTQAPAVSRGVFSGYVDDERNSLRYLQTDAAVNPGSSGGPIIDAKGQTVGIVVQKVVGEGYEGLGLAIPGEDVEAALSLVWKE